MEKIVKILTLLNLFLCIQSAHAGLPPNGSFTVSPGTTVTPNSQVCFTNTTTGSGNTYSWTNNGTQFSTATSPCLTFTTAGAYNICLTASNSNGADTSPACQTINVVNGTNIATANGTTIGSGCGLLLEDSGGGGANYSNNENYTVTFCSGTANYVSMSLMLLNLGSGDLIRFYQGTGTGGTSLGTISSAQNGTAPVIAANNTCITVQFTSDGSGVGAGFLMQANCYPPTHIIMGSTNSSNYANACGMTIYDPGYTGNYSDNQTATTTICASNPSQVPQILFNSTGISAGDVLYAYDGNTTGGSLIYDATNTDNGTNSFFFPGLTITGESQCMTLQFVSNSSGVNSGFNGSISCVTPPAPCNANPIASDNFDAATLICDFSQYCGVTSSFYGVDMPNIGQTAVFNGSLENNSWLMFIADAPTASFTVSTTSSSCYIQIGVYGVNASEGFTWQSPASINGGFDYTNVDTGFSGTGTLNANGLVPGQAYYIMIDGHGGSVCSYTLTAGIGVQLPVAQASPDLTLACGQNGTLNVTTTSGNNANVNWMWEWTGPTSGGPVSGSSINLNGMTPGVYTYTATASNFSSCVTTAIDDQVVVTVEPCPLSIELANFYAENAGDFNNVVWITESEINNSHFILERSDDALNWETIYTVQGAGNSTEELRYYYHDHSFSSALTYYRLTQFDIDGENETFPIVSVKKGEIGNEVYKVINLMGQEIDSKYNGARIIQYTDGTCKKIMGGN